MDYRKGANHGVPDALSRNSVNDPEKEGDSVNYARFIQWEKSWTLYGISDTLETLSDKQQTAILLSMFTKELLSDLEYRFKINIDTDQKVEDVLKAMKEYLMGQRSMLLARYNLFT